MSSKRSTLPWNEVGPPLVHRCRHSATVSSSRAKRPRHGTSDTAYSASDRRGKPAPTVSANRPPESRSSEAITCAACTGRRNAGSSAAVPSVTRSVTAAAADSMVNVSMMGRSSVSPAQRESKPRASARRANSIRRPGSVCSPHRAAPVGRTTPIRMSSTPRSCRRGLNPGNSLEGIVVPQRGCYNGRCGLSSGAAQSPGPATGQPVGARAARRNDPAARELPGKRPVCAGPRDGGTAGRVAANDAFDVLTEGVAAELLAATVNVYRLALHPQGMAPRILNIAQWAYHIIDRIQQEALRSPEDDRLTTLHAELNELAPDRVVPLDHLGFAVPLQLRSRHGQLRLVTTVTAFATAVDVTLAELKLEAFLPADQETAAILSGWPRP